MRIAVFDTETTGLLLPDNAPLEDQPKIIEFHMTVIDEEFNIIEQYDSMIDPGELVTEEITQITGIKNSDLEGKPLFADIADDIRAIMQDADISVAHNIAFDNGMVGNEFKRIDQEMPRAKYDICTVEVMREVTGRRISLTALHKQIFGSHFKAHRAKNDVFALIRIFHHLTETGVIKLDLYKD